ncbi:MAG: hypothetical protein WKF81_06535 [Thermomicrobiales bacterium]
MASPPDTIDVVHAILGIDDSSVIARLRKKKPGQIDELQAYYRSIFEPETVSADQFPVSLRALVALRVATHTRSSAVAAWYADLARESGAVEVDLQRASDLADEWSDDTVTGASLRRTDKITLKPSSAQAEDIDALTSSGLTPGAILSLSQVIAFVSYQLRFVAVLRAVGGLT